MTGGVPLRIHEPTPTADPILWIPAGSPASRRGRRRRSAATGAANPPSTRSDHFTSEALSCHQFPSPPARLERRNRRVVDVENFRHLRQAASPGTRCSASARVCARSAPQRVIHLRNTSRACGSTPPRSPPSSGAAYLQDCRGVTLQFPVQGFKVLVRGLDTRRDCANGRRCCRGKRRDAFLCRARELMDVPAATATPAAPVHDDVDAIGTTLIARAARRSTPRQLLPAAAAAPHRRSMSAVGAVENDGVQLSTLAPVPLERA